MEILELESTIIKMKIHQRRSTIDLKWQKERISKLADRLIETMQFEEQNRKRMKESKQNFREICHTIKYTKTCILEVPAEEKRAEKHI